MDPATTITAAAVAGLTAVATDAAKETATQVAKKAWGKIKSALGWNQEPPPDELEARATQALADHPELTAKVQEIVNDYRQQIGGVSVGSIKAKNSFVKNTFNGPTNFN